MQFDIIIKDGIERDGYYVSIHNISDNIIKIKLLPDDEIIDGELRRRIHEFKGQDITKHNIQITPMGAYYINNKRMGITHGSAVLRFDKKNHMIKLSRLIPEVFPEIQVVNDIRTNKEIANSKWNNMKNRCERRAAYDDVEICDEWLEFGGFYRWWNNNIYKLKSNTETLELDKDILGYKSNKKIYSPDTCLIIPKYINNYFIGRDNTIANMGAYRVRRKVCSDRFSTMMRAYGKRVQIGTYKTVEEAHEAYINYKNKYLQDVLIPRYISDIHPKYLNHPMVLKVIDALRNCKFT